MKTEEFKVNDEVIYNPMKILGAKLKVIEIASEINLVHLSDEKDFNVWVHASEISLKQTGS